MLPVDRQAAALCPPSPTGKHHWMIPSPGAHPVGICKYCLAERPFENSAGEGYWDYKSRQALNTRKYIEGLGEESGK
jgi:hypothetical protein